MKKKKEIKTKARVFCLFFGNGGFCNDKRKTGKNDKPNQVSPVTCAKLKPCIVYVLHVHTPNNKCGKVEKEKINNQNNDKDQKQLRAHLQHQ